MIKTIAFTLCISVLGQAPAFAGAASDLAKQHIDAIAAVDGARIAASYEAGSKLHWVGGPLNGTYTGSQIGLTWGKFGKALGPLTTSVTNLEESGNPAGSTVTANVVFSGKSEVRVRYIMLFQNSKLIDEIWQIDPKLGS